MKTKIRMTILTVILLSTTFLSVTSFLGTRTLSLNLEKCNESPTKSFEKKEKAANYLLDIHTKSSLIPHEPITIMSDEDFTKLGLLGAGTKNDPYLIKDYLISTNKKHAISINGTTKYFVISNCYLNNSYRGIYLDNVTAETATIVNNVIEHTYNGIETQYSDSFSILNNTFVNNQYAIDLYRCNLAIIQNNTIKNNNNGIRISYAENTLVENNVLTVKYEGIVVGTTHFSFISDNDVTCSGFDAIEIRKSSNITINGNMIKNTERSTIGLHVVLSSNITIYCNSFVNTGLYVSVSDNLLEGFSIYNNTVNGFALGWLVNKVGLSITLPLYGELHIINCSDILVSNQNLSNTSTGLYVYNSKNITISKNKIRSNKFGGVRVYNSDAIFFQKNTISNNLFSGTFFYSTKNSTIENNVLVETGIAITTSRCTNVNISENTILDGYQGIHIYSNSEYINVQRNLIKSNIKYGITLISSNHSSVEYNAFIDNNKKGSSQAYDDGYNNIFSNNYWSDHTNPDNDADGIVDYPYPISGGTNKDSAPLNKIPIPGFVDSEPPKINSVTYFPLEPTIKNPINITVNVTDNVAILFVSIFYRISKGSWYSALTIESNGVYNGTIGPFKTRVTIDFFVQAKDSSGNQIESEIYSFTVLAAFASSFKAFYGFISLLVLAELERIIRKKRKQSS
ncbi:MAG: NosD domain-containing protein [Candidatus Heimdallarchaeaceae archaeon]